MTEKTTQSDGQKTVVAFVAGLLVGGLLVWIFNDTPVEAPMLDTTDDTEMSDDTDMSETEESNTETATGDSEDTTDTTTDDAEPEMQVGDAEVALGTVNAGSVLALNGATFPTDEGWVAVRSYTDGELGWVLGASRYSREQGLIPETIQLLSPMVAGQEYAIVFFSENGDRTFDLATDAQLDTEITTFTAQ